MRYGTLFEVEIQHDYFQSLGSRVREALDDEEREAVGRGYAVAGFLRARPTEDTRRALAGHRAIFRSTAAGFLVGVQLDPSATDDRPALPLGPDLRFRFGLEVRDPRFLNYTVLPESAPGFYFFDNGSGNEVAGSRLLSRPVPSFQASRAYEAGEVRAESAGAVIDLFRAERDTGPSATPVTADWRRIPPDTFDTAASYTTGDVVLSANRLFRALVDGPGDDLGNAAEWQPIGILANQYVTAADGRALVPARFDLDLSGAALPRATVRLRRAQDATTAWERVYAAAEGSLGTVPVDLGGLRPGAYRRVVLDGTGSEVAALGADLYVDPEAVRAGWFGVVEIGPGEGGMALLDGAGVLRSPRYVLRFLNRATRWRYVFDAPQAIGSGAEVAPEGSDPRVLVTVASRPLTRLGTGVLLQEDSPATPSVSEKVLLPEPDTRAIRRRDEQWFSDVHTINLRL